MTEHIGRIEELHAPKTDAVKAVEAAVRSEQACRFEQEDFEPLNWSDCATHKSPAAPICEIGLAALYTRIANVLEGQSKLAAQTVRIRCALGVLGGAEGDTEDYAKELRATVEEQARVMGRLREAVKEPLASWKQRVFQAKEGFGMQPADYTLARWIAAIEEAISPTEPKEA